MSKSNHISNEERLNLKKLVNEMDCEDNTEYIRKVKHSMKIRDSIRTLELLKKDNLQMFTEKPEEFRELAQTQAHFLFFNYTDIFNKILKDELDLDIMTQLLYVLNMIEEEKVDQHEGSVLVGKILKKLYVDSALKRCDNLDKEHSSEKTVDESKLPPKSLKWNEWKQAKEIIAVLNANGSKK